VMPGSRKSTSGWAEASAVAEKSIINERHGDYARGYLYS
jgi:hypothetical protein